MNLVFRAISLIFACTIIFTTVAPLAWSQGTNTAHTTGTCSPAISGTTNQVTINCNGVSAAKTNQMIVLMNRILTERLDVSEVNAKLDQLHSDVASINSALNPFAKATPEDKALLKNMDTAVLSCSTFTSEWSEKTTQQIQDTSKKIETTSAQAASVAEEADQQKIVEYKNSFAPRLDALTRRERQMTGDRSPVPDYTAISSAKEIVQYELKISEITRQYLTYQMQNHRPIDQSFFADARKLQSDLADLAQGSIAARRDSLTAARAARRAESTSASEALNTQEVTRYRQTLMPRLLALQARVAPQVPGYTSQRDYQTVNSVTAMSGVCSDLNSLSLAYRQKLAEDLQARAKP